MSTYTRVDQLVGYAYEAGVHCEDCTLKRFPDVEKTDSYPLDNEGNQLSPIFFDEAEAEGFTCEDCGFSLDGEDNSIYTVSDIAEGAIEREESFVLYPLARQRFDEWRAELADTNLSSASDGVFLWDTALCRMVAEYSGKEHDGGSLIEYGV